MSNDPKSTAAAAPSSNFLRGNIDNDTAAGR
jgi:hypothetical protein